MRPQQNRRMRGRSNNNNNNSNNNNNRRGPNPLTRNYESSGPDVKIRGNAQHIADKYLTLSRDAQSSGDRVMAENYLQHAEHYMRIILSAQGHVQQTINRDDQIDNDIENAAIDANDIQDIAGSSVQTNSDNHAVDAISEPETIEFNNRSRDKSYGGRRTNGMRRNPRQPRSSYNSERNFEREAPSQNVNEITGTPISAAKNVEAIAPTTDIVDARKKRSVQKHTETQAIIANDTAPEAVEANTSAETIKKSVSKPRVSRTRAPKAVETAMDNSEQVTEEKPRKKRNTTKAKAQETEA